MKFTVVKKGYERAEVDEYVAEAERTLNAQKERITAQKKKISALEKELEAYHERKELILAALSEAVKKAEEIERRANQKYDLEIQRLRQFHNKWTEYYVRLIKQHPLVLGSTEEFNREMDKILRETECARPDHRRQDAAESLYIKEKARLKSNDNQQLDTPDEPEKPTPLERIKKYLENSSLQLDQEEKAAALPSEAGVFSLEEALHPSKDLAGIMKDLGLIFED